MTELSREEKQRYSRHILLPEVGLAGQKKLKQASAIVIGAGGLGSPVSLYLAAAGVGRLALVDFDQVDLSNLQRQVLYNVDDVGKSKAEVARAKLQKLNPEIEVQAHGVRLSESNIMDLLSQYDIVIDGSDNFTTRYLVNDACVILKKPNVHGSIYRFEGQVSVFSAQGGPCYRCLFPVPPPAEAIPNCAEGGVLGVLAGLIGSLEATEAIKLILGQGESLIGKLLVYNALEMQFQKLAIKRKPNCPVCGDNPTITKAIEQVVSCASDEQTVRKAGTISGEAVSASSGTAGGAKGEQCMEITAKELAKRLREQAEIVLLDVRNPDEVAISKIAGSVHIPLPELPQRLNELSKESEMVVYCKSGVRSLRAIQFMQQAGFKHLSNLRGGIIAWANEIDPSLALY